VDPVCFKAGPFTVHWYGVAMALGFLLGLGNWAWLARREGRPFAFCSDLLFWIMVSGIAGARLAYVLGDLAYFLRNPLLIFRVDQGGLVYYGGFIGAGVALAILARRLKEPFWRLLDFVITSVPLAHMLGRVGCFINGCCYGTVHRSAPSVRYPFDSLAWHAHRARGLVGPAATESLPVHPVQLYEAAFNLLVYGVVVWVFRNRKRDGQVTAAYLLLYPVGRFAVEFLRGDGRVRVAGLSLAQWLSLGLFAIGCGLLASRFRRRGEPV
jgi:phosphatidylglycerol:prolipoprotein diacylglycerol transferase